MLAADALGESVSKPIEYNSNNVGSLLTLLGVMRDLNVKQFVFSSSATVYGLPKSSPIDESFPLYATNPYGQSKLIAGQVLRDLEVSDPS
jgi:UDP-glucose 4-epimerase